MVNYNFQTPNIGQQFMGGYSMGQEIMAKRAAQQRQAEMQEEMGNFAMQPNKTANDYQQMMLKYPEMSKQIQNSLQMFNDQQKQSKISQMMSFYAPLKGGNTDAAKARIDEMIAAYRNSGQELEAKNLETLKENIDLDPTAAQTSAEMFLFQAMGPDDFKKFSEASGTLGEESRAAQLQPEQLKLKKAEVVKAGIDAGLTQKEALKTEAATRKLDAETQKIFMEMAALEKQGPIPPEKKFEMEQKLSDKYYKRSADYLERRVAFDNLLASGLDTSGAGDYALVKSFEKMLDPGSVVREGEFALAQAATGKLQEMMNFFTKFTEGTRFKDDKQRQYYVNLARKYMESAEKADDSVRNDLTRQIERYGLDPKLLPERREIQESDIANIKAAEKEKQKPQVFVSIAEAEAASANMPKGTRIQVGNDIFEVE